MEPALPRHAEAPSRENESRRRTLKLQLCLAPGDHNSLKLNNRPTALTGEDLLGLVFQMIINMNRQTSVSRFT